MPLNQSVPADGLREIDDAALTNYIAAFHAYMASEGLQVRRIPLDVFLGHYARCGAEPFAGFMRGAPSIFWGVYADDALIATWAAKPYTLLPGETLRAMLETRGAYPTDSETWRLEGDAADLADTVTVHGVFEGGLVVPKIWRKTLESEIAIREVPSFVRAFSVHHWRTPHVWFFVKAGRALASRFQAQHLADTVTWTKDGALKDNVKRSLGVSHRQWIEDFARDWPTRQR